MRGKLKNYFPSIAGPQTLPELDSLVGATVLDVGFHPLMDEGGLTIDYSKDGEIRRIVLGYTELGLWVEYDGPMDLK